MPPSSHDDRPPSEQTVEYRLLDAITELNERLATPLWDTLYFDKGALAASAGQNATFVLPGALGMNGQVYMHVLVLQDRVELTMMDAGHPIWHRTLLNLQGDERREYERNMRIR